MARYRKLMPDHFSDKNLARISDRAHRIWCLMITPLADDDGRFELDIEEILAKLYSFHRDVCITEIENGVIELQKHGLIEIYKDTSGFLLCQLLAPWPEWAGVKGTSYYKASQLPSPQQNNIIPFVSAEQLRNTYGTFRNHSALGGGQEDLYKEEANVRAREEVPPAASSASFSKSKKKSPRRSASSHLPNPPWKLPGNQEDVIAFKNFPAISRGQIEFWALEFEKMQTRDACRRVWIHLCDLDKKMNLPKSKGGMDKPIGDPVKNLHALLKKRYGG